MPNKQVNRRPFRVLFIIDQLQVPGGAEKQLLSIIEHLSRQRCECSLVTFRPLASEIHPKCPVYVLPLKRSVGYDAVRQALELRRIIRSGGFDVVHTFFESSDFFGGVVGRLSGCRVLISSRRDLGILRNWKHRIGYHFVNPLFDRVLAVAEEVRRYCIETDHLDPDKVVTLHNGVDLDEVEAKLNAQGAVNGPLGRIPGDVPVVVMVANIRPVKGVDVLLRAAAEVRDVYPGVRFVVVGESLDASYFHQLQRLRDSLNLEANFLFAGRVPNVFPYLRRARIYCQASHSEGLSNALLEAMASGLPCIATDVGGSREAVAEGITGYLVPPANPLLLSKRILDLLGDPERVRRMGANARSRVEREFDVKTIAIRLTALYDDLVFRET